PNHGGDQSSRHGQSNDQPDPGLGCRLRAAGLLEVAVPGCCGHDRLTLNNEPGATETVASVHKVLGASTVRRPRSEVHGKATAVPGVVAGARPGGEDPLRSS